MFAPKPLNNSYLCIRFPKGVCCRDGGMVDTRDLKSLGHSGCAGSSPARGTDYYGFELLKATITI